jgi:hypothetical protein
MKEVVDAIGSYNLPIWIVIIIGGGTIIAAMITALQAIVVASINARAARAAAVDAAHREHRVSTAKTILEHVRGCTTLAFEIDDSCTPSDEQAVLQRQVWLQRLKEMTPQTKTWVTDAALSAALGAFRRSRQQLERALSPSGVSGPPADFSLVRKAARTLKETSAIAEMAVEGYAFGVSRISRQAKRRLQRLTGERWVIWGNHRYFYWPPSRIERHTSDRV